MIEIIAKGELVHGASYLGHSRQSFIGTWDGRQNRFHTFTKLEAGAIVQVKMPHVEDADGRQDAFEPIALASERIEL